MSGFADLLLQARRERSWSRRRAAVELRQVALADGEQLAELDSIERAITRHEKGRARPDMLYASLYHKVYGISDVEVPEKPREAGTFRVTSHKFIMAHLPHSVELPAGDPVDDAWFPCTRITLESPFGTGDLYSWPFGTISFHLRETRDWESLCDLAAWRVQSYDANMAWLDSWIADTVGTPLKSAYVLSAYWVDEPSWPTDALGTAVHLLSVPKTLLTSTYEAQSPEVERTLMTSTWRHPDVVDFGVEGIAVGAASWSGVAYAPTDAARALREEDLVRCELGVQALWAYCDHITRTDEAGDVVETHPAYGPAWLRRARSRLTIARAQESGQHRSMRSAIVATSSVAEIIDNAIQALKDGQQ